MHKNEAMELCRQHMNRYVLVQMNDGTSMDGIVAELDDDFVYLAVPMTDAEMMHERGFGAYGGFYPYYNPYYPFFPYGRRRFRRVALPLALLTALTLLPYY